MAWSDEIRFVGSMIRSLDNCKQEPKKDFNFLPHKSITCSSVFVAPAFSVVLRIFRLHVTAWVLTKSWNYQILTVINTGRNIQD